MLRLYLDWLREELAAAQRDSAESHKAAMNSYGAGHDAGRVEALRSALNRLENPDETT